MGSSPTSATVTKRLGDDGSFDFRHHHNGGDIEVRAEMKSTGTRVQRTDTSNGNGSLSLGVQIEIASVAAFRSCAEDVLGAGAACCLGSLLETCREASHMIRGIPDSRCTNRDMPRESRP